jgi:hypothetical protein
MSLLGGSRLFRFSSQRAKSQYDIVHDALLTVDAKP